MAERILVDDAQSVIPTAHNGERHMLALEASWELECLGDALINAAQGLEAHDLAIRSMSIRVRQLAQVVMSALGDDLMGTAELRAQLTGERTVEETHHA